MQRRSFVRASGAVGLGLLAAGCSGGPTGEPPTPTDLLGPGDVSFGGLSVDAPEDGQGGVEYYRAVAGIENTSGGTIDYARGKIEFLDDDGGVLESTDGDVVGFPAGRWWALVGEYSGENPAEVARAEVTSVEGIADAGLEDARDAGEVELADVTAERGADERTVSVTGEVTNSAGSALDSLSAYATLWVAEDRVVASAADGVEGLAPDETWTFEATYQFSPNSAHLVPIVTDENEVTVPYVGGRPPFAIGGE